MATYTDNYNLVKPTMAETADIRTINGNMDSIDNILHASQVSLAPAYNANSTYNTGDVVMYELLMYECLDDDVTGTWDATKWQRTTAGEHGGGGGGSNVSITPTLQSGTKIADFEIDGVSGALYAPSGGGGGAYVDRLIFDTYVAGNGTYELLESIDNYDALLVCGYGASGDSPANFIMSQFVTKAEFYTKKIALLATVTGSTRRIFIQFPDSTHVTTSSKEGDISLRFIYGIKFGGGGGGIDYSTEEQDTGLKWIDGRTIYQKTIVAQFSTTTASGNFYYGSLNLNTFLDITDWQHSIITGILDKSYLRLSDGTYRIPAYFDFQGSSSSCALFFYFAQRSGELTLTIQYVKGDDLT